MHPSLLHLLLIYFYSDLRRVIGQDSLLRALLGCPNLGAYSVRHSTDRQLNTRASGRNMILFQTATIH